ncbi:MAG: hypothetical protein GXY13_12770, partial [Acidimicrobiales bacterium]|nr:hypothetical protein [Acidimicrobiales bacterium]
MQGDGAGDAPEQAGPVGGDHRQLVALGGHVAAAGVEQGALRRGRERRWHRPTRFVAEGDRHPL